MEAQEAKFVLHESMLIYCKSILNVSMKVNMGCKIQEDFSFSCSGGMFIPFRVLSWPLTPKPSAQIGAGSAGLKQCSCPEGPLKL